jgi:flagellar hook assembly protein FlgD
LANYPNPFNPTTEIVFQLPFPTSADLSIYDTHGRPVNTLVSGPVPAGVRRVTWDGRDREGKRLSSGVYFYTLRTPATTLSKKMTLLK